MALLRAIPIHSCCMKARRNRLVHFPGRGDPCLQFLLFLGQIVVRSLGRRHADEGPGQGEDAMAEIGDGCGQSASSILRNTWAMPGSSKR